jgi:hypothetical protein
MHNVIQRTHQFRSRLLQLSRVKLRKRRKNALALRRNPQQNTPMVSFVAQAPQQTLLNRAIHQFDGAVVLQQHSLGHVGDGGQYPIRHAAHALQHLVLLVVQPHSLGGRMAHMQKSAQLKSKLSQALQMRYIELARSKTIFRQLDPALLHSVLGLERPVNKYIVSRYISSWPSTRPSTARHRSGLWRYHFHAEKPDLIHRRKKD